MQWQTLSQLFSKNLTKVFDMQNKQAHSLTILFDVRLQMITKNAVETRVFVEIRGAEQKRKTISEVEEESFGEFIVFCVFFLGMIFCFAAFGAK
jgi:hypothetical protein